MKISFFTILKIALSILSLLMVLTYEQIPLRNVQLFPANDATLSLFSDEANGGNSTAKFINDDANLFECHIKQSSIPLFCGASVTWWNGEDITKDLSVFEHLYIDISYIGASDNLVIFSRNEFQSPNEGTRVNSKQQAVTMQTKSLNNTVKIELDDFRVPDWWINSHYISPEYAHIEMDKIITIGAMVEQPFSFYPEQIGIKKIIAEGKYFSKENLYGGLLLFWATLLLGEGTWRYLKMMQRVSQDEKKLKSLTKLSAEYKNRAETDLLTGLRNRDGLAQSLAVIEKNNSRQDYGFLLIDIDHFKQINDQYGHDVGDKVLEELGILIKEKTRLSDLVTRWGGEEFIVLFRREANMNVFEFAEQLRLNIASNRFVKDLDLNITATIGAVNLTNEESFEKSFKRADTALYAGKRDGRNIVKVAK